MSCSYCGRDRQDPKHMSCDGCGASRTALYSRKPVVLAQCCGVDVTDPHDYAVLLKSMYGYGAVKSDEVVRFYLDKYNVDERMMKPCT